MRSVWQSLLWKEWHEHKWKLAALTAILCGITAVALIALMNERLSSLDGFLPALIMGMIPLTIFIGAGEAAGENAGRTMPFLQALPVPMWKAAAWKLVLGAVSCLLPLLIAVSLVSVWYFCAAMWGKSPQTALWHGEFGLRESVGIDNPLVALIVAVLTMVGIIVVSLLIWTAALGVNRKSEVAAGALALLVIVVWWTIIILLVNAIDPDRLWHSSWFLPAMATEPGGIALIVGGIVAGEGIRSQANLWWAFAVATATHLALVAWYLRRFGRTASIGAFSPQPAILDSARAEWLGPPRRSPLTAIVWKQVRESGPAALAGLAAILFFVVVTVLASSEWYLRHQGQQVAELHASLTMSIGFLVVLIVGIGVFDHDLSPKIHTFWRSRPIHPDLWYWTKYLTGLVVLVVVLGSPVLISGVWYILITNWWYRPPYDRLPELAMVISILVAVYALALTTICLVRVTIYAAILSVGVLAGGMSLAWFFLGEESTRWMMDDWAATITAMMSVVAVLATLVGWWAVRRDVGWKNG